MITLESEVRADGQFTLPFTGLPVMTGRYAVPLVSVEIAH